MRDCEDAANVVTRQSKSHRISVSAGTLRCDCLNFSGRTHQKEKKIRPNAQTVVPILYSYNDVKYA